MGTISKTVQHRMKRFRQKELMRHEFTIPGWGDSADYFSERDKKYGTSELKVLAVVKPQMDHDLAAPTLTTYGELMESLDIVPGRSKFSKGLLGLDVVISCYVVGSPVGHWDTRFCASHGAGFVIYAECKAC